MFCEMKPSVIDCWMDGSLFTMLFAERPVYFVKNSSIMNLCVPYGLVSD